MKILNIELKDFKVKSSIFNNVYENNSNQSIKLIPSHKEKDLFDFEKLIEELKENFEKEEITHNNRLKHYEKFKGTFKIKSIEMSFSWEPWAYRFLDKIEIDFIGYNQMKIEKKQKEIQGLEYMIRRLNDSIKEDLESIEKYKNTKEKLEKEIEELKEYKPDED